MIRIVKAAVATSIQDLGRFGNRAKGYSRSGAMDTLSLRLVNALAGAHQGSAAIEFGPGSFRFEVTNKGTIALGGAQRSGAPWWQTLDVKAGQRFDLGSPTDGVWSYLAINAGVAAPLVMGSRSTQVREGIGHWLVDEHLTNADAFADPEDVDPPPMTDSVRILGTLEGALSDWSIGTKADRMGYHLDGPKTLKGDASRWSEPLLPGCVQILPSGKPIVLMAECPTVGGYAVAAHIHSEDLRLIAQARPGTLINFIP